MTDVEFKPGDIVRFKGKQDEWEVRRFTDAFFIEIELVDTGHRTEVDTIRLELVRRPGPVVFECTWMSDGPGLPFYPATTGKGLPELEQFWRKKTRVTIEVIE